MIDNSLGAERKVDIFFSSRPLNWSRSEFFEYFNVKINEGKSIRTNWTWTRKIRKKSCPLHWQRTWTWTVAERKTDKCRRRQCTDEHLIARNCRTHIWVQDMDWTSRWRFALREIQWEKKENWSQTITIQWEEETVLFNAVHKKIRNGTCFYWFKRHLCSDGLTRVRAR